MYLFASISELIHWVVLFAVYLVGCQLLREKQLRDRCLDWFLVFGFFTVALAVTQYFTSGGRFLWMFDSGYPELLGPFQNRNNFAAFVELLVPLALWRAIRRPAEEWRWLAATAVLVAAVVASTSRAGTAIVFGEVLVVLALSRHGQWINTRRLSQYAFVLAGLIVTTTLVVGWDALLRRVWGANPFLHRPEIMESALSMVAARPCTGFGPGTFETVYPAFALFDVGQVVNYAHNDWLEWAAEGGIPLLLAMALFAAWHVRPALRSVWGVGVLAVFVHALVDFPFQRFGVAGWVFLMLAAVAAEAGRAGPTSTLDDTHRAQARHLAG